MTENKSNIGYAIIIGIIPLYLGFNLLMGLMNGKLILRGMFDVTKKSNPIGFWILFIIYSLFFLFLLLLNLQYYSIKKQTDTKK